jgi:ribose 5-phosphate isomerase B
MYTPWIKRYPRCACGAIIVPAMPVVRSFHKFRRRLTEESAAIWIESNNVRLLMLDGVDHGPLPMVAHRVSGAPQIGEIAFLGPWVGEDYTLEGAAAWSFRVSAIPAPLSALLARLGIEQAPVVTPSISTIHGIHTLPGATRIMAIAADHAGRVLKERLIAEFADLAPGWTVIDIGGGDADDDYPDVAATVSQAISEGRAERGVLICGSGIGVTIAANKHPGIRASIAPTPESAAQGVEHDALNVLAVGARTMSEAEVRASLRAFAAATPSTEERHRRRLAKVAALEARAQGGSRP